MSLTRVSGALRQPTRLYWSRGLLSPLLQPQQRAISSSSSDAPQTEVLARYHEKLQRKAREEGHAHIVSLRQAYDGRIRDLRRRADFAPDSPLQTSTSTPSPTPSSSPPPAPPGTWPSPAEAAQPTGQFAPVPPSSSPSSSSSSAATSPSASIPSTTTHATSTSPRGVRPLDSMIDVAKARSLPVAELTAVWRLRHAASPRSLCAVIPAHVYAAMDATARSAPQFVLPVPVRRRRKGRADDGSGRGTTEAEAAVAEEDGGGGGGGGAEMHFLQWTWDVNTGTSTVLFTQLAEYKLRGEWAAPHTTITHHSDFAADKGVVLMQGAVVGDRAVKVEDAQWLAMCLQRFYGELDEGKGSGGLARERAKARRELVQWFARGDERFSVDRLMEEAERMG